MRAILQPRLQASSSQGQSQSDRLFIVLKDNRENYTIDSRGRVILKPEYAEKGLKDVLRKLKDINIHHK